MGDMSFDERMDRIAERHAALAQTVELLGRMQQDFGRATEDAHRKNQVLMTQVLESIDSLARIAHPHEHRISDLEGGRA